MVIISVDSSVPHFWNSDRNINGWTEGVTLESRMTVLGPRVQSLVQGYTLHSPLALPRDNPS